MKYFITIIFVLFNFSFASAQSKFPANKIVITNGNMSGYEQIDGYVPHDFLESFSFEYIKPVRINKISNSKLEIINEYNDGSTYHKIKFLIDSNLCINEVTYFDSQNAADGSEKPTQLRML